MGVWTLILFVISMILSADYAFAEIKWINEYTRSDGTYVRGHYRDTSNDGNPWNNANTLGYNRKSSSNRSSFGTDSPFF